MRIDQLVLYKMFEKAGVDKHALYDALREYGPAGAHKHKIYQHEWSWKNPTRGYCWVVTQFVLQCVETPNNVYAYKLPVDKLPIAGEPKEHWYLKSSDGDWIDLTAEQFGDNWSKIDYSRGEPTRKGKKDDRVVTPSKLYREALSKVKGEASNGVTAPEAER